MTPDSLERRQRGRPKAFDDKREQNTIKALDRALVALKTLSQMRGATLSELADALDQAPATVYRVLQTLEGRGMVEMEAATQTWHVGAEAFLIGSAFLRRTNLVERARPILRRLMEETGETANLGVARGDQVLFVAQAETHDVLRAFFPPGTMSPMIASGVGKALLAVLPEDRRAAILAAGPVEPFTPKTLTDRAALAADLAETARRGYAIDDEERTLGMRCVAAPVFDPAGEAVAGVSVSGPSIRLATEDLTAIAGRVRQAADDLTAAIGGRAG